MTTKFFLYCFVSLVRFSYWSKFHVNIITGSGVMTIFCCRRLTRNLAIRNTPIWVLPNIWRLRWVRNTKFDTNVSNEMLLNAAKCQGYSFYRFWVIKGKPTRAGVKLLPLTQIKKTLCRDGSPSILSILEFLNQYFKYFNYGSSLIVVIQFQQKKQLWQRENKWFWKK